jgi:hypothetical protein
MAVHRLSRWALLLLAVSALSTFPPLSAQNTPTPAIPRTADGKPDFNGTYQWPTYLPGDERGRSNATIFDRKRFAPFKPGGEPFYEPRTGDRGTTNRATSACPPVFPPAFSPATPCSSSRRRLTL